MYLHQDASKALLAAIETSTYAPNMNAAPGIASDNANTSAREAIIPIVNGLRGDNTAAFHFAFIEQGGTSLYPSLAQRVTTGASH